MKKRYTLLFYQGEDSQWYWRMLASNKKVVADGSEGYSSKSNLLRAVKRLKCLNFDYILVRELVIETPEDPNDTESMFRKYFGI
jgi:uncharacterized protein YegP (UPF0339 family)